jgi:hypothetical protein
MKIRSYLRAVVFVAAAAAAHGALAQGSRVVTIDPGSEDGLVRLSYIDDAAKYNFEKMFEIPMLLDQEPLALVLRNTSGQAIVAVTIRWTATTAGRSGVYDSSTDSLGMQAGGATSTSLPLPGQARPAGIPAQLGRSW